MEGCSGREPPGQVMAIRISASTRKRRGMHTSVDAFGAVGDGTTDATGAFNAALGSMINGGVLVLGPKTYAITSLHLSSGVTLRGQGDASVLKATTALAMIAVDTGSPTRDLVL